MDAKTARETAERNLVDIKKKLVDEIDNSLTAIHAKIEDAVAAGDTDTEYEVTYPGHLRKIHYEVLRRLMDRLNDEGFSVAVCSGYSVGRLTISWAAVPMTAREAKGKFDAAPLLSSEEAELKLATRLRKRIDLKIHDATRYGSISTNFDVRGDCDGDWGEWVPRDDMYMVLSRVAGTLMVDGYYAAVTPPDNGRVGLKIDWSGDLEVPSEEKK